MALRLEQCPWVRNGLLLVIGKVFGPALPSTSPFLWLDSGAIPGWRRVGEMDVEP